MSLALKIAQDPFFKKLFIGFLADFDVSLAKLEHTINQASKFVSPGIDGRRCSKAGFNAPYKSANGTFTLHSALSSQAQGRRRAIAADDGLPFSEISARLVPAGQSQMTSMFPSAVSSVFPSGVKSSKSPFAFSCFGAPFGIG